MRANRVRLVPTSLVHSAKSWLSNPDVDRTAKILPWDSQETGRVLSPVEVSARFLKTFREAWDAGPRGPLAEQDVVLTVPASFDEEARELTVLAAHEAGIPKLTLLEEPAAAFYSWIANNFVASRKLLFDGQVVLVCDVGGGTSDFSLIRVARDGDRIDFTRTAVGKHLLLGGDNLDLTLAWLAESKIGTQLSIRQRSGLRRQCSAAKERLLSDPNLASVEIQRAGRRVVADRRDSQDGNPARRSAGADARRISAHHRTRRNAQGRKAQPLSRARPALCHRSRNQPTSRTPFSKRAGETPDAILFNGGFFIPEICRKRVADVLEHWYGKRPEIFENRDLDLAVASGAAYYSYVRSTGSGVLVRGGLPRTYYIAAGEQSAVCLVPRGAEEGDTLEVDREDLHLVANRPVSFRLFSSLTPDRRSGGPGRRVRAR